MAIDTVSTSASQQAKSAASLAQQQNQVAASAAQSQFLTLLVTQLRNQDPLNPMDNAEVTSQIAQLSTVSGIQQLNTTLKALSGQLDMSQSLQATSLIGHDVLVPGTKVGLGSDPGDPGVKTATAFGFDLLAGASDAKVAIHDAAGALVRTIDVTAQDPGVYPLYWDGLTDTGAPAPDGAYTIAVQATDANGQPVAAQALTSGTVGSVAYTQGGLKLDLGLAGQASLTDVRQVM